MSIEKEFDPAMDDDADDEGGTDVEWFPLPSWLQPEGDEEE